ncbi:hypothetical protein ACFXGE_21380, partial [Streptomyces sp. NPDC059378]
TYPGLDNGTRTIALTGREQRFDNPAGAPPPPGPPQTRPPPRARPAPHSGLPGDSQGSGGA